MRISYSPSRLFGAIILFASALTLITAFTAKGHLRWGVTFKENDIIKSSSKSFQIEAIDLIPEPGEFSSDSDLLQFYSRQSELLSLMDEDLLELKSGEATYALYNKELSLVDLPLIFWIQIIVGFGATIVAGWIWSLRPKNLASGLFFLSGLSTLCFTYSAAIYTTRELVLPLPLFKTLVGLNVLGASLFGISTLALFLIYPSELKASKKLLLFSSSVFGTWTLLSLTGALPVWVGVNLITLTEMICIVLAISAQFFVTRGLPKERASLTWLGLSILVGAGGFICLNAIPLVFGVEIPMAQGYAFLFFLAFYLGLAAGIGKYRLFDVGNWAFRFLFYALGAFFLVLLDIGFIALAKLEKISALGLSFFIIGFFYLPLRDWLQNFFKRDSHLRPHDLIKEALYVVLSPNICEKRIRWEHLLQRTLNPVEITIHDNRNNEIKLMDSGAALLLPSIGEIPSYVIKYRNGGKSLFNKDSLRMMDQLIKFIECGDAGRATYERGVKEERQRMAQDLHDDVGARLLTGLHSQNSDLRATIQEAITDIRTIVKGIAGESTDFSHFWAELRAESVRRAEASNLNLNWPFWEGLTDFKIDYHIHKAISSTVREIISNAIRHSNASILDVQCSYSQNSIEFCFKDNGKGLSEDDTRFNKGIGLNSMRKRITNAGGEFKISNLDPGLKIIFKVPV